MCYNCIVSGKLVDVENNQERWMQLARLAASEQDPKKLLALVIEINQLLEQKQERLNHLQTDPAKLSI
jgi:hypothetical protein